MIRFFVTLLTIGLVAPGVLHAATPQNTARPVYGALDAAQLNQIQTVGRSVLAAKGSQQSSVEEQALLSELHNLSASVDQALRFTPPTSLSLESTPGAAASASVKQGNPSSTHQERLKAQLVPELDRLSQRCQQIDAMSSRDEATKTQIIHVQHLSTQAGILEQSVRDALAVTDDAERFTRLAQIKQRLRSRSLQEYWNDREEEAVASGKPLPAKTPTLTTLTKHRPGLDDKTQWKH